MKQNRKGRYHGTKGGFSSFSCWILTSPTVCVTEHFTCPKLSHWLDDAKQSLRQSSKLYKPETLESGSDAKIAMWRSNCAAAGPIWSIQRSNCTLGPLIASLYWLNIETGRTPDPWIAFGVNAASSVRVWHNIRAKPGL